MMIELYSAYFEMQIGTGYGLVKVHWIRQSHENPVAPYSELIANYQASTSCEHDTFGDELFTFAELAELRTEVWSPASR